MFFHVLVTTQCDLQCRYCYDKSVADMATDFGDYKIDYKVPSQLNYDVELLRKFCEKDPQSHVIFYGGEPLLFRNKIREIIMNAVGYDRTRNDQISVENIPFDNTALLQEREIMAADASGSYEDYLRYGIYALLFLFVYVFVIRPFVGGSRSKQQREIPQMVKGKIAQGKRVTIGELEAEISDKLDDLSIEMKQHCIYFN